MDRGSCAIHFVAFIMDPPMDTSYLWRQPSMREIIGCLPHATFSSKEKKRRANLEGAIMQLTAEHHAVLEHTAVKKLFTTKDEEAPKSQTDNAAIFFETVSEECRCQCISKFIDATRNKATATVSCAVCAGSFFKIETKESMLSDLPKQLLEPFEKNTAQTLTDGMLLDTSPASSHLNDDGLTVVNLCHCCIADLAHKKTPPLSLANGMWIGDVPLQLSVLTLPEHVLIAHYFSAAHIVKLFPKKKGARCWSQDGLHHALRGNVSTYPLNTNQIVQLASNSVMLPSPAILATTIGVTFIGPNNLPQRNLPPFLHVNHTRVWVALEWLKAHNPLYSDITISQDNLEALPVNGIPREIVSLVKYSDDTKLLAEEMDGYVPCDVSEESRDFEGAVFSRNR